MVDDGLGDVAERVQLLGCEQPGLISVRKAMIDVLSYRLLLRGVLVGVPKE